jgi:hypothetical protein
MPVLRGFATDWYSRLHPTWSILKVGVEVWIPQPGWKKEKNTRIAHGKRLLFGRADIHPMRVHMLRSPELRLIVCECILPHKPRSMME